MTIDQNRIKYLLAQYAAGSCTDIEQQELMALLEDRSAEDIVLAGIDNWMKDNTIRHTMSAEDAHKTLQAILSREPARVEPINKHRIIRSPGTLWLRYAAAIILIFGIGAYLYNLTTKNHSETASIKPVPTEKDIAPGKDGAILTLADGRQIVLDSLHNGIIAEQTGTNIVLENGKLEYTTGSTPNSNKTLWNTMSTPRGRQFQVILPDGTKVWLNTASSLKYPTVFQGSTRIVEINGEAYFDVAGNKQMPFIVKINGGVEVQVLGTEFN
ncbi:MAG: FecR domain-containing protein, partial [Chitinophagaceae bacterium]|nr:FecR domain-containing protein [Chitinophagaceae bacterium]